jgi:ureidoglycolate hydrolase
MKMAFFSEETMEIKVQELTEGNFKKFGKAILVPENTKPDMTGESWECWYPISKLIQNIDFYFGIVLSQPGSLTVEYLERHLDRPEYVIALDNPVIQVVGLTSTVETQAPDSRQTQAFLIEPGQSVMINPGVWHSASLAIGNVASKYMFLLGAPTNGSKQYDSGLVKFLNGETIVIKI